MILATGINARSNAGLISVLKGFNLVSHLRTVPTNSEVFFPGR